MNILKSSVLFILLVLFVNAAYSNDWNKANSIGSTFSIDSKILAEKRNIQIYLPESYHENQVRKYPVLYLIAGQRYFLQGVSFQQSFNFPGQSYFIDPAPDFIVVGINTDNTKRYESFFQNAPKLIKHFKQELIPYIDKNYKTSNERILFGWEIAGGTAMQIFANHTSLFSAYIVASPAPFNYKISDIEKALTSGSVKNRFVYFTMSSAETWAIDETNSLAKLLKEKAPKELDWHYDVLENEDHYSTPTQTIYQGLRTYFSDYTPIRFYSLSEYNTAGGLKPLYKHYKKRGERYGLSNDIHGYTKHFLILESKREENYAAFKSFLLEFDNFLASYPEYGHEGWFVQYGEFCLKNNDPDLAIVVLDTGLKRVPNSAAIHNMLGNAYRMKKDFAQSAKFYNRAIKLAKAGQKLELAKYKANLKSLNN